MQISAKLGFIEIVYGMSGSKLTFEKHIGNGGGGSGGRAKSV